MDVGGSDGARTHDILLAKQALSQLSYTPVCVYIIIPLKAKFKIDNNLVVDTERIELPTPTTSKWCSPG